MITKWLKPYEKSPTQWGTITNLEWVKKVQDRIEGRDTYIKYLPIKRKGKKPDLFICLRENNREIYS